ncbi:hypothetical protein H5410_001475 [Solanum commersonii]|uniref:Uncharacterized protein n=1 Tax=Solanum commersonii TaxID=4109 RepID=A0A9J6AZ26_SOLCO|nr:hypothetical protein H5410_001475 [Solanum commersonii]
MSDESLFMVTNALLQLYTLSHFRRIYFTLKFLSLVQDFIPISVCLVTIDLSGCVRLTILTFFTLARYFPSIEEVHIENSCFRAEDCFHNCVKNLRIMIVNCSTCSQLFDMVVRLFDIMCSTYSQLFYSCTLQSNPQFIKKKESMTYKFHIIERWSFGLQ